MDISVHLLRERQDPSRHRFEVRDEESRLVMEIWFTEVLRPGRSSTPTSGPPGLHAKLEPRCTAIAPSNPNSPCC